MWTHTTFSEGTIVMISFHIFLIPMCCFLGVPKYDVANQLGSEVKTRHLDNMGRCKVGLEFDFIRVDMYQYRNRRGFSSIGRSRAIETAKGQVNDARKVKRVIVPIIKEVAKVVVIEVIKNTKIYKKAKEVVTNAYKKAKEVVTNAYKKAEKVVKNVYKKAKEAISRRRSTSSSSSRRRSTSSSSRRRSSSSSSRRRSSSSSSGSSSSSSSGSSSSSSSSGGGGWWRR